MTPETLSVNGKTYRVLRLLGHGKGGYSYLVTDGEGQYTLKQIHQALQLLPVRRQAAVGAERL